MDSRERAEKIVNECSKRWIEESPDGFGCNLDLLSKEIEYHLIEAKREGMEEAACLSDEFHEWSLSQRIRSRAQEVK